MHLSLHQGRGHDGHGTRPEVSPTYSHPDFPLPHCTILCCTVLILFCAVLNCTVRPCLLTLTAVVLSPGAPQEEEFVRTFGLPVVAIPPKPPQPQSGLPSHCLRGMPLKENELYGTPCHCTVQQTHPLSAWYASERERTLWHTLSLYSTVPHPSSAWYTSERERTLWHTLSLYSTVPHPSSAWYASERKRAMAQPMLFPVTIR